MSSAPWSVKGIDPKTREAAKESARRSGMTLGEWLNQRIREEAAAIPKPIRSDPIQMPGQAEPARLAPLAVPPPLSPSAEGLSALTDRINAAEQRSTLAITGLDQSLRGVLARMENAEEAQTEGRRKIEERLAKVEQDGAGPRSAEALRVLEASMSRVAHRAHDSEARLADSLDELKREIGSLSRRLDGLEKSNAGTPGGVLVLEQRMEQLAITLTARVDQAKAEMSSAVDAAGARSAHTVERIGHEVLRMADSLGRRVEGVENRAADAIEQVGGEVAKVISNLDARLQKTEGAHAQALEKLGGEIARITEKLSERIAHSERRAAQAIDDVGEQVARTTERLNTRYDRASADLAERIRQSEERTARLLEEAKERIDTRLAEGQRRLSEQVAEVAVAPSGLGPEPIRGVSYAERASFADPFTAPAPPVIYPDAAPFGQTFAPHGFVSVEPDFARADLEAADDLAAPLAPQSEADFITPAAPQTPVQTPSGAAAFGPAESGFEMDAFPSQFPFDPDSPDAKPFESPAIQGGAFDIPALEVPAFQPPPFQQPAFQQQAFSQPEAAPNAAPGSVSTRQMLDQARAAALAASQPQGKAGKGSKDDRRGGRKGGGLPFLGRKSNLKNALMTSVAVLALGTMFYGAWTSDVFKGVLPDRVAKNLKPEESVEFPGPEFDTTPRAAMALDPRPIDVNVPPVAEAPMASPNAVAMFNEGVQKLEKGDKTGLEPLRRAANLGLPDAQAYLGRLYEGGLSGVVKDPVEARRWYERAAQSGDRMAMHNLGYYYFEGTAGPKNLTVAAEWFRRAAMLGVTDSQYNLAKLYEGGQGVTQNSAEAYKWYMLAALGGTTAQRTEARAAANRVGVHISESAKANAERTVQTLAGQISANLDRPAAGQHAPAQMADIALAQRALVKLGFFRGAVDGQVTTAFKLALQAYQREKNIPATGQVDQATFQSLRPYVS